MKKTPKCPRHQDYTEFAWLACWCRPDIGKTVGISKDMIKKLCPDQKQLRFKIIVEGVDENERRTTEKDRRKIA